MKKYHTTRDGQKMLISDMNSGHLMATIKFIEKKAEDGFVVAAGGSCPESFYFEEAEGPEVLDYFDYDSYLQEAHKRGIDHSDAYLSYRGKYNNYFES